MASLARRSIDPVGNYAFSVEVGGVVVCRCEAVDGLAYEVEMIEYRVSDQPNLPRFRPGASKFGALTLKGGFIGDTEFVDWMASCQAGVYEHKDLTLNVYDNAGDSVVSWNLFRCLPAKWSLTSSEGKGNDVHFDNLELRVEEAEIAGKGAPAKEGPRVITTKESKTGRNTEFEDTQTGETMSREEFVAKIEAGEYEDYHIRNIDGVKTPAANPNSTTDDNLG